MRVRRQTGPHTHEYVNLEGEELRAFLRLAPCVDLGDRKIGKPCGLALYQCNRFGDTTSKFAECSEAERCCKNCNDYVAREQTELTRGIQWIGLAKLQRDALSLAHRLPANVTAIGGIPRSGMIPASLIAAYRHLPLWTIPEIGHPHEIGKGSRGQFFNSSGPIAVIDDSLCQGTAMHKARTTMANRKAIFGAVYVRSGMEETIDFYGEVASTIHILEWNWANNASGPLIKATDLDGIIIHDEKSGGRAGEGYMVPRRSAIPIIITGRHERYRTQTESQLRAVGAKWNHLAMLPDHIEFTPQAAAKHKADRFAVTRFGVFIESDPWQAAEIHRLTGRAVICPQADKVFQ